MYSQFAVNKVRENMSKDKSTGGNGASDKQASGWQTGQRASELQSYSSKMMKAIWGQYNRYSVHNFKSNQASCAPAPGPAGAGQPAGQGRG